MRKTLLTIAAFIAALCMWSRPNVEVESITKIALPDGMMPYTHTISPDGQFAVVQSDGVLSKVDIATGSVNKITDSPQAFQIKISPDGTQVGYLEASFAGPKRQVAVKMADIASGKVTQVVKPSRNVNTGIAFAGNTLNAVEKGKLHRKAAAGKQASAPIASINYGHLDITIDGKTTTLDPQGHGSYLWPSVSPDGTKVVYWLVGEGCFVCNIDGSNIKPIGELRAAVWAGNDKVVGMLDRDNGITITSSEIRIADLSGDTLTLSPTDQICMYPSASADGSRIIYANSAGELYLITLKK